MNGNHPQNIDPRPKRRRDQDNPYEIFTVGCNTDHPHYFVSIRGKQYLRECIEISRELFELLDKFELEDLSFLNEVDNHYEHSELTETSLNARSAVHSETLEDIVEKNIQQQNLHKAISQLPNVQRRRLVMYYFEGLTYAQIAEKEGCIFQAVAKSISAAKKNLREKLIQNKY